MGKKLFRFGKDLAARREENGPKAPADEQAAPHGSGSRMRDLIKQNYSPQQIAVLKDLETSEGATRYSDRQVEVQNVVAPGGNMLKILSDQTGLRVVQLSAYPRAEMKLRNLISSEQAKRLRVVPVERKQDGTLVIAIADPTNPTIADELRLILDCEVETVIADEGEIAERLDAYYGMGEQSIEDLLEVETTNSADEDVISSSATEIDLSDLEAVANQAPIIKLVNILLMRAISERASDIHIEPFPTFIRIRYRVDGVLREIPSPPRSQLVAIVSRVKVIANMNISESRLPQDGRIKLTFEGREIDLRVSTVPTVHGESIVMRVLDKSMMMIGVRNIGMLDEVLEKFVKQAQRPNGILLCTGPTGCGKTTTLYSILREIQDPGLKIITTEDPVEYELAGIQQVNINENVGLTYARSLRAILRQDPDIVLVGEIRDVETAQIAVQASLTGHLVFSTLHTNSAAATITRLLDMGVEPFLITSALEGVVGQRLVRTICQNCKAPYKPDDEELLGFGVTRREIEDEGVTFFHGEGCEECGHSGFHGRMGIYELLEVDDDMRELILERATTDELHEAAIRMGMITMRQDGWMKICLGLTTFGEIARQTPKDAIIGGGDEEEEEETGGEPVAAAEGLPGGDGKELPKEASREALPDPKSQLKVNPMIKEGEAAIQASKSGDAQRTGN
jgi:type II secretion system protein E